MDIDDPPSNEFQIQSALNISFNSGEGRLEDESNHAVEQSDQESDHSQPYTGDEDEEDDTGIGHSSGQYSNGLHVGILLCIYSI